MHALAHCGIIINYVEISRIVSCHVGVANQSQNHYENSDAK